ncbi:ATP-dependent helicase HrpB [Aliiroseovarius sp. PTFE2010]|uniref:ATP-dependent helicase HrpB n=1 Tax=Aliiroseovarius sp. PTFE2010 TaxID=3417190 RepID=UPI003CEA6DFE
MDGFSDILPVDDVLGALCAAVKTHGRAVLQAPPGAGKTTRVPLALLRAGAAGRIVMLEPRRLAARAAAERMAQTLGEPVGKTVGYRVRGEARVSKATRIEVVTEGILTRMIQSDPGLEGIGVLIFDEFHERSLNGDLGLALAWEVRGALREDLAIVVMSATLDAEPVAAMLDDAPVITSQGRAFPVAIEWLARPARDTRQERLVADAVVRAIGEHSGGVLVFLPGEREIRRVEASLAGRLPDDVAVRPLFGAMAFDKQRAAIAPMPRGRKVVLATSIAETSLTIEDIRVVVDGGLARRARFDPGSGMSRLVTERVSRAEAEQRRGRAGRVAEGVCYRLWTRGEEGALRAYAPPEIETADLSSLALELALWGATPDQLPFLTPPPEGAFAEARALLGMLGALDGHTITAHGRKLAALPLHPRLGHMLAVAGRQAAPLAALLADRDPLRGAGVDLSLRLRALRDGTRPDRGGRSGASDGAGNGASTANTGALHRIRAEAKRLARTLPDAPAMSAGEMAALAYPDRIGLRRKGDEARYLLSGGKGAVMDQSDALAGQRLIVVTDTDGAPREARIRQASALSEAELRGLFGAQIGWHDICEWDGRAGRVMARRQERFGALVLDDRQWKDAPDDAVARAMLDGVRALGLPMSNAARRFCARVALMGEGYPDMSETALLERAEDWLLPFLGNIKTAAQWKVFDLLPALRARLDYAQMQALDAAVPARFTTPLGREIPIDYAGEHPQITARIQEMFGTSTHPTVGPAHTPLRVTLTSPAHRPVQTTMDLPGFWKTSYADVRKDMRGRYPKHPWPEDPTQADPTLRAKPRK